MLLWPRLLVRRAVRSTPGGGTPGCDGVFAVVDAIYEEGIDRGRGWV